MAKEMIPIHGRRLQIPDSHAEGSKYSILSFFSGGGDDDCIVAETLIL